MNKLFFCSRTRNKTVAENLNTLTKTPSVVSRKTKNALKYLFAQSKYSTTLCLHNSMLPLNEMLCSNHNLTETYYIDHLKSNCRTQWYLTVSKTQHMSQVCKFSRCLYCPIAKYCLIDLSDDDLNNDIDGSICFREKQILTL